MTVMAHEQSMPIDDDSLLDGFLALDTPEGFHAELVEGEIVVTPPPVGAHEANFSHLVRQVLRLSATDMDVAGNKGLALPGDGRKLRNMTVPDATFAPCDLALFDDAPSWMEPEGVALVAEITSSRAELDREAKRRLYALGGRPPLSADRPGAGGRHPAQRARRPGLPGDLLGPLRQAPPAPRPVRLRPRHRPPALSPGGGRPCGRRSTLAGPEALGGAGEENVPSYQFPGPGSQLGPPAPALTCPRGAPPGRRARCRRRPPRPPRRGGGGPPRGRGGRRPALRRCRRT
ncbi:Putative restriction endonuclease [Streptomyces zhaozhouensis]|uniref:Restriction endonuclease n=1 Tax=Streptomyces zhaozhouensis TaxID=1300267 RepID=A0A286DV14_9ACTN|nr:Putative restriction endonuclease [Streptomyces zhaozhouensis]